MPQSSKILVVAPAWVGDMVMAQALFKLLKRRLPAAIIDVLAPVWAQTLLERMPEVRKVIPMPLGHGQLQLKKRWQLGRALRAEHYDQSIVLPNSWKSAVIPWAAKIPQRTGWFGEWRLGTLNDARFLNKQQLPLMAQRFLALGLSKENAVLVSERDSMAAIAPYHPQLRVSAESVAQALSKFNLSKTYAQPILALCPGAEYGSAKRWPAEYYAAVAKARLAAGWAVWIFGSAKDQPIAAEIQQQLQNAAVDFTGRTTLGEAVDLLSLATVVVSNDSGLMHIAAALQRPLVVLYGSSSPQFTPPLSDHVKILTLQLFCSPCFQRECPLHHLKCLHDLSPSLVLQAIDELVTV